MGNQRMLHKLEPQPSRLRQAWASFKVTTGLLAAGLMTAAGCDCSGRPAHSYVPEPDGGRNVIVIRDYEKDAGVDAGRKTKKEDAGAEKDAGKGLDAGLDAGTDSGLVSQLFLIGDYIDRIIGDRGMLPSDYSLSTPETDPDANPFTNGLGGTLHSDLVVTRLHRMAQDQIPALEDTNATDANGNTYGEKQDVWVQGNVRYLETAGDVVADIRGLHYTLKFSDASENGIPANALVGAQIMFLGEPWGVIAAEVPAEGSGVYAGGSITIQHIGTGYSLTLTSGARMEPDNPEYRAVLGWKNGRLRTVITYTTDTDGLLDSQLETGDSVPLIQNPTRWMLLHGGLDISNADRDTLRFWLERDNTSYNLTVLQGTGSILCDVMAPYVRVDNTDPAAFSLLVGDTMGVGYRLYIGTNGVSCSDGLRYPNNSVLIPSGTSATEKNQYLLRPYGDPTAPTHVAYPAISNGVVSIANGGVLTIASPEDTNPIQLSGMDFDGEMIPGIRTYFILTESAGPDIAENTVDRLVFPLFTGYTFGAWHFNGEGSIGGTPYFTPDNVRYYPAGPVTTVPGLQAESFITERGSVFDLKTDVDAKFRMARILGSALIRLVPME